MVLGDYEYSFFRSNSKVNFINHSISLKSNLISLNYSFIPSNYYKKVKKLFDLI